MTTEIDYEGMVKSVYPDAWAEYLHDYSIYVIRTTKERYLNPRINGLTDLTKADAWKSSYSELKQQGKL